MGDYDTSGVDELFIYNYANSEQTRDEFVKTLRMVREKTDELLDKVLRERSNEMKIAYARADA